MISFRYNHVLKGISTKQKDIQFEQNEKGQAYLPIAVQITFAEGEDTGMVKCKMPKGFPMTHGEVQNIFTSVQNSMVAEDITCVTICDNETPANAWLCVSATYPIKAKNPFDTTGLHKDFPSTAIRLGELCGDFIQSKLNSK